MALKKQLLIFFVAITALLLPVFFCSCDRKDIDPKDCYGKWVPKDGKSPSKCISLHKDGTVEFFDLNWNDVGATEGLHSMPRTGVWQLGSRYENAGGLSFMPAKAIYFSYGKGGFFLRPDGSDGRMTDWNCSSWAEIPTIMFLWNI